jgi:hypothetical protein
VILCRQILRHTEKETKPWIKWQTKISWDKNNGILMLRENEIGEIPSERETERRHIEVRMLEKRKRVMRYSGNDTYN